MDHILQTDDIKVVGANILCFILLQINEINDELRAILFIATITYTIVRTINEIKKLKKDGKGEPDGNQED